MTTEHDAIKTIFTFSSTTKLNTEGAQLEFLSRIIPNSVKYLKRVSHRDIDYWDQVKQAAHWAKKEEDKGKWLYMISDSDMIIHWFACPPGYEKVVEMLEPILNLGGYFEPFYAEDYYQEDR